MENNQGGGGSKKLYIAVIIILVLINAVAFYLLITENRAKTDLGVQKAAVDQNLKSLTDTLSAKEAVLDQYKGKNTELDSIINARETVIEAQKKQLASSYAKGKMSATELAKAKEMIDQDEKSITELQNKIKELTAKNMELTNQNLQLTTDLTSEKKTTEQLSAQNQDLSKKVELGSLLQLKNIMVEGIAKKKNGKEVVEKKAKKTESLRITFETGDNKVLPAGQVSLFIRIINPKGETISVADQGSGTLKDSQGQTVQYTKEAPFDWAQTNKKIVLYWAQNIKDPGTYKVEIYQSGYVQGTGSVELK